MTPWILVAFGTGLTALGTVFVCFRDRIADWLLVFVPWMDTAFGRIRGPQASLAMGALMLAIGVPVLVINAAGLIVDGWLLPLIA